MTKIRYNFYNVRVIWDALVRPSSIRLDADSLEVVTKRIAEWVARSIKRGLADAKTYGSTKEKNEIVYILLEITTYKGIDTKEEYWVKKKSDEKTLPKMSIEQYLSEGFKMTDLRKKHLTQTYLLKWDEQTFVYEEKDQNYTLEVIQALMQNGIAVPMASTDRKDLDTILNEVFSTLIIKE